MKESENGKGVNTIRDVTDDPLFVTRIGALLDFYSDRAVAHASFFVASIFGLVTLLTIIQQLNMHLTWVSIPLSWYSILLFFAFSYLGYYTLGRFGFYADMSQKLNEYGLKLEEVFSGIPYRQIMLREYMDKQEEVQNNYLILRKIIASKQGRYILPLMYWILIIYLGSIVYSKFWHSWIEWMEWFGFLAIFVFIFVISPQLYSRMPKAAKKEKEKKE